MVNSLWFNFFRQFGAIGSVLGRGESNLSVYVCGHKEEAEDALICMKLDRRSDSWIDTGFRGEVGPYSAAVKIDGEDDVLWITGSNLAQKPFEAVTVTSWAIYVF